MQRLLLITDKRNFEDDRVIVLFVYINIGIFTNPTSYKFTTVQKGVSMEQEFSKFMTPFDCQTTPRWIYILKLMLPYTPERYQHSLAIFIRFQEMQFTMKHFNNFFTKKPFDFNNILNDVKPYMNPETQEMMEQMESMMSMMEMMESMQMNDLSDLFNMKGDSTHE